MTNQTISARGRAVNQTELAQIIGVTDVTIWEWQKIDGFPILQRKVRTERGQENLYDTSAVIFWKIDHEVKKASGPESQRDRLTRAQAALAEMDLAARAGELVSVDQIEPAWTGIVNAVKQALLSLPMRLATVLETTPGIEAKRELMDEEVRDILTKLSTHRFDESSAVQDSQTAGGPAPSSGDVTHCSDE